MDDWLEAAYEDRHPEPYEPSPYDGTYSEGGDEGSDYDPRYCTACGKELTFYEDEQCEGCEASDE